MAIEVGSAYVSVVPSFRSFGADLQRGIARDLAEMARRITGDISGALADGGRQGGEALGEGIMRGADGRLRDMRGQFVAEARTAGEAAGDAAGDGIAQGVEAGAEQGGASLTDTLKTAALAAAAVVGATFAASLAGAIEKQNANALLAAQLGATPAMAGEFGRIAGNLYKQNYGESIADINEALKGVWQNGLVDEDAATADIEAVTKKAINLASIMGEDYSRVTVAIGQMLRTGMAGSATEAFDLITRGVQQGVNKSEDLLDTFNEYSTQFRKLGLDGPAAMGLLSQAIRGGARDSDVAADALKEFSIRAVDGSTASADAFKALGLDAKEMTAQFAAGGPAAAAGLQTVLDRLRAIKDPAAQSAAAVGLFGTQAEDLGAALFAFDPSTAVQGLGDLAGAADRVDSTLGGTAAASLESFKRQVTSAFVDFVGGRALPAAQQLASFLSANFAPAVESVAGALGSAWAWLQRNQDVVLAIVAPLGAMAATIGAVALATKLWAIAVGVWTAVAEFATAVQVAWNASLFANPIGLIVLALVALVAGLILAYNKVGWFKAMVDAAWKGIVAGAQWLWSLLQPIFTAWWGFAQRMGAIYMMLWQQYIQPALVGIATAATWAWSNVIMPLFRFFVAYLQGIVIPWVLFLWRNVFSPAFDGIAFAVKLAWTSIQITFGLMMLAVRAVGAIFMWLWNLAIKPAIDWIVGGWTWAWNTILKPLFSALGGFITDKVAPAFRAGIDAIGKAWDSLRDLARKPVEFVVKYVINPLIRGYNAIAGKFGAPHVDEIQGFATGGKVWGEGTETSDSILARLSRNEHVWTADEVRKAGGHGKVMQLRQAAKQGMLPSFADGGIVDWVLHPIDTAKKKFGGYLDKLSEIRDTPFGQLISEMPRKIYDGIVAQAKSLFSFGSSGSPGGGPGGGALGGSAGMMRILRAVFPDLPLLSGYRPGSRTLSGGTSYHASDRAVDVPPRRDVAAWIYANYGTGTRELITPFQEFNLHNGRPHTYTGAVWNQHNFAGGNAHDHWAYDAGGMLPPGMSTVTNNTRVPEPVLTPAQWKVMKTAAVNGISNGQTHYHLHGVGQEGLNQLEARQARREALARIGRPH